MMHMSGKQLGSLPLPVILLLVMWHPIFFYMQTLDSRWQCFENCVRHSRLVSDIAFERLDDAVI